MINMLTALFGALSPLWEMSLTAAYVAAVVALLRLVLKRRAPKQVLCLLWLVVFARLLVPMSLESPLSIVPGARQVQQLTGQAPVPPGKDGEQTVSGQPAVQNPALAYDPNQNPPMVWPYGSHENPFTQDGAGTDSARPVPTSPELPAPFPWRAVVAGVWLAGALAMGGYGLVSYLRLKRRLYDAIRAQDGAWEHPDLTSPFILGMFRPKIYLPAGLCGRPRQFILCHERAHLRRRDHIVKPVCWLALALHWFNPLAWMAFLLMSRDIEAACDEAVIRQLGPRVKADYSETLLSMAARGRIPAPCPLAFDEGNAKGRIKNVLSYRRPALWIVAVSVVAAALAAVCLLTDPVPAQTPEGDPAPDASAPQDPDPSQPPAEGDSVADPWMLEVLGGERSFRSGQEEYHIHQLRAMLYGDEEPPRLTLEVGRLAVMDLDRDGINEMVVWPVDTLGERDDPTEIGYYTGYFVFRRHGDVVEVYYPGWRSIGNLKADGTFHWSNSAFNWGTGRARFDGNGSFEVEEITWCVNGLDKGVDGGFYVDGLEAAQEEFEAAIAAQSAKPEPAWYIYEGGRLWPAPLEIPFRPESLISNPGPRALTQEELAYFQAYFALGDGGAPNIRSMLLVSEYDDPRDIDLYSTFYHGFHYAPDISQAERDALGWNGNYNEIKVTAKEMDETLRTYLGLGLEETNKVGLDLFRHLPEYDAYYAAHTDFWGDWFTIYSGQIREDGSIELTYDGDNYIPRGLRVAVLEAAERPYAPRAYYQMKSNLRAEAQACGHGLESVGLELVNGRLVARCTQDGQVYPVPGVLPGEWGGEPGTDDGGWFREDMDGDGQMEVFVFIANDETPADMRIIALDVEDGALVTDEFRFQTLIDDFNRNSGYTLDLENKVMEVSYDGHTKQAAIDDKCWAELRAQDSGFAPELRPTDMWITSFLVCGFHVYNGLGHNLGLTAIWGFDYSAGDGLQARFAWT